MTFSREEIDDLPGHVQEKDGEFMPYPRMDVFLEQFRKRVDTEVERLAKLRGKQIGF